MTSERKILVSLGAVAVLGLVVDRVALGPAEADAALAPILEERPVAAAAAEAAVPAIAPAAEAPVARRLDELALAHDIHSPSRFDAFTCPPDWHATQGQAAIASADNFMPAHRLTAVVRGERNAAVVNGQLIHVGEQIDGRRLIAVDRDSATFEGGGGRIRLVLSDANQETSE